jgi:alpha-L-rhamnosidase
LLIGALRAATNLGKYLDNYKLSNYSKVADKIAGAFHSFFWDDKKQFYASFIRKGVKLNYAQLTQGLAIIENVCPEENIVKHLCREIIEDETLIKAEFSSLLFIYEALLKMDIGYLTFVLDDIRNKFGKMIKKGATSLWETVDGAEAFSRAGSLCHGWSSIFNYIAGAYILGVKPLEPGFKTFTTVSHAAELLNASGKVPTPYGQIEIREGRIT